MILPLKRKRIAKGDTLEDAADKIGTHIETLRRWESNTGCPTPRLVKPAAKYYGVTCDDLAAHIVEVGDRRKLATASK